MRFFHRSAALHWSEYVYIIYMCKPPPTITRHSNIHNSYVPNPTTAWCSYIIRVGMYLNVMFIVFICYCFYIVL